MAHPRQTGHHLQRHPRPDLSYPFPRVQQEYEEVLPYHAFAVRIPQHAIYRLPEILDELMQDPEKVSTILAGTQRLHEQPQNVSLCISWCFICPPLPSAATVGGVLRSHPGKGGRGCTLALHSLRDSKICGPGAEPPRRSVTQTNQQTGLGMTKQWSWMN